MGSINGIIIITYCSQRRPELPAPHDRKANVLLNEGTLNPAPEKVRDPKFREGEFFDPRDAVQVKYEMLRRVSVENASITDASEEYGVSRPTFYQAKASLKEAGIAGLVPRSAALAGRTSFRARFWRSSRDSWCRASRSGHGNSQG